MISAIIGLCGVALGALIVLVAFVIAEQSKEKE